MPFWFRGDLGTGEHFRYGLGMSWKATHMSHTERLHPKFIGFAQGVSGRQPCARDSVDLYGH